MGCVFSLYKRKPKERYELGKVYGGFRPGYEPKQSVIALIDEVRYFWSVLSGKPDNALAMKRMELVDPGWAATWSIMGTPDYSSFRMTKHSIDELTDKIYRGLSAVSNYDDAKQVAKALIEWAGDDDIVLIAEEPTDLTKIGWPVRGYRLVGSVYDI